MSEQTYDAQWPHCGQPPAEAPSAGPDDAERLALIDALKIQIRNGVYRPDIRDLARSLAQMMVRSL